MSTQINSISQLEEEKKKLKMQMEVSKRAFIHSFGATQSQAKDFLVKKVAIPAGAVGLVTVGARQLFSNASTQEHKAVKHSDNNIFSFAKIITLALPFIQSFLAEPERLKQLPPFLQQMIASKEQME